MEVWNPTKSKCLDPPSLCWSAHQNNPYTKHKNKLTEFSKFRFSEQRHAQGTILFNLNHHKMLRGSNKKDVLSTSTVN